MTAALPEISLRSMEPEDLDFLYGIENDPTIWDVGATNVPYSRYTLYEYIANSKNDIYADRQVRLIIEDSQKHAVGTLDITDFDPRHMRAQVGIVIQKSYRHKGLAQAALTKASHYAFHTLGLHQLYAIVPDSNQASLKLFENCGFTLTSELRDWLRQDNTFTKACLLQVFK